MVGNKKNNEKQIVYHASLLLALCKSRREGLAGGWGGCSGTRIAYSGHSPAVVSKSLDKSMANKKWKMGRKKLGEGRKMMRKVEEGQRVFV